MAAFKAVASFLNDNIGKAIKQTKHFENNGINALLYTGIKFQYVMKIRTETNNITSRHFFLRTSKLQYKIALSTESFEQHGN